MTQEQRNEFKRIIAGKSTAICIINKWATEGKAKPLRVVFLETIRKQQ